MDELFNEKDKTALVTLTDFMLSVSDRVPLVGPVVSLYQAATKLEEDSFNQKLADFFEEGGKASQKDKERFLKKLGKDAEEFYKRIIKILNRFEDREKAKMLGCLYRGLCQERISIEQFKRLGTIIDNTYISTLTYMHTLSIRGKDTAIRTSQGSESNFALHEKKQLVALGLLTERINIIQTGRRHKIVGGGQVMEQELEFEMTELGSLFVTHSLSMLITAKLPQQLTFLNNGNEINYVIVDYGEAVAVHHNERAEQFQYSGEDEGAVLNGCMNWAVDDVSDLLAKPILSQNKTHILEAINKLLIQNPKFNHFRVPLENVDVLGYNFLAIRAMTSEIKI